MKDNTKQYLLDSSFASFTEKYLVEKHNQKYFELEVFNEKNTLVIQACEIAELEYLSIMKPHIQKNLQIKKNKEFNTFHLMALESANEKIRIFIDSHFSQNSFDE